MILGKEALTELQKICKDLGLPVSESESEFIETAEELLRLVSLAKGERDVF